MTEQPPELADVRQQIIRDEIASRCRELMDYFEAALPPGREKMLTFVYLEKMLVRATKSADEIT